jgi:hypothetical protein
VEDQEAFHLSFVVEEREETWKDSAADGEIEEPSLRQQTQHRKRKIGDERKEFRTIK